MSFNPFIFEPSIGDRLNAATIAAASQGAWNTVAPPSIRATPSSDPYIVYEMIAADFDTMTFQTNIVEVVYRVHVYDHRKNGIVPAIGLVSLIIGDSEGTDNAPTYGLHRWKIPAVTDAATAMMRSVDAGTQHEEDRLHFWVDFAIENQEA